MSVEDIDKRLDELEKEYNKLLSRIRKDKNHMEEWFKNKRKIEILAIKGELERWKNSVKAKSTCNMHVVNLVKRECKTCINLETGNCEGCDENGSMYESGTAVCPFCEGTGWVKKEVVTITIELDKEGQTES